MNDLSKDILTCMKEKFDSLKKEEYVVYILSYLKEDKFYYCLPEDLDDPNKELHPYNNIFDFYNLTCYDYIPEHFRNYFSLKETEVFYDEENNRYYHDLSYKIIDCNDWKKTMETEKPYSGIKEFMDFYNQYCEDHFNYKGLVERTQFYYNNYFSLYFSHPQVEQLIKCKGFEPIILEWVHNPNNKTFLKNFKPGNSIDEITGLTKKQWHVLTNLSSNIKTYNELRILCKKENLTGDDFEDLEELKLRDSKLIKLKKICLKKINGQRVYDLKSIIRYLKRVDMYQAVESNEAIEILFDYVSMCSEMDVFPIVDSNALKREHDVCTRNYNLWRQSNSSPVEKSISENFENRSLKLSKYNFEDEYYLVTTPKVIQDLIVEGINNHNCVGSYIRSYASGRSNIFFIRKKECPQESYITIEVAKDCTSLVRAYLGFNQLIGSSQDKNFIRKWLEHNRLLNQNS